MRVTVIGPMSSGTNLVSRLLDASPDIDATADRTHGINPPDGRVVVVTRDEQARSRSAGVRWPKGHGGLTAAQIAAKYPDAPTVAYETVAGDPAEAVRQLADSLGLNAWVFGEPVYDANTEPGSRCGPLPCF